MPKTYNAQLPVLSDWMGKMKLGKALSRQSWVLRREKKKTLRITASPSTAMVLIIARQQALGCLPVENGTNKQSSPLVLCWSHTAGLDFEPKFQGPQKGTMNNGMRSVEWGMYQDNVCVLGAKRLVSRAKKPRHCSARQVRGGEKQNKMSGIRCFFGDKQLFS